MQILTFGCFFEYSLFIFQLSELEFAKFACFEWFKFNIHALFYCYWHYFQLCRGKFKFLVEKNQYFLKYSL